MFAGSDSKAFASSVNIYISIVQTLTALNDTVVCDVSVKALDAVELD